MNAPLAPAARGAVWDGEGVTFSLYSARAQRVELCLFAVSGVETGRHELEPDGDDLWRTWLAGIGPGQQYGYRVHGPWVPEEGLRFNPAKLLLDPWARRLAGQFRWAGPVYDFLPGAPGWVINDADSAPWVPRSVVCGALPGPGAQRPAIPWAETVIYEANVRGYTMRHPGLSEAERGRFRGLANGAILGHLKALGVTAVELLPVFEFIDEDFLVRRGQRNLWGYNPVHFFAPAGRYAGADPLGEFTAMVDAIHQAGLEVILDVVYNHTGEGDARGPTLSLRGIDNLAYYRTEPADPARYVNDTGCGNTLNADHREVQAMVIESLCHWHGELGVDGFRFDLATVLGRTDLGFDPDHPLLTGIAREPRLAGAKLIAEPWDPGPGGYQSGRFPPPWAELNDRFRDTLRRFWRGDPGQLGELARRMHGSADLFEASGRPPWASVNPVTNHDGFTLVDLVSYERRHNQANGHANHDGHSHNFSCNHGVEGPTADPAVISLRRRHRLNLLATLMFSQGTPMLLAGDEFGNSQAGNNNAYAQDNETGWLDWSGLAADPGFTASVARLTALRRQWPQLRRARYVHGREEITWLEPGGQPAQAEHWAQARAVALLLPPRENEAPAAALAVLVNGGGEPVVFELPWAVGAGAWTGLFHSDGTALDAPGGRLELPAFSVALLAGPGWE